MREHMGSLPSRPYALTPLRPHVASSWTHRHVAPQTYCDEVHTAGRHFDTFRFDTRLARLHGIPWALTDLRRSSA